MEILFVHLPILLVPRDSCPMVFAHKWDFLPSYRNLDSLSRNNRKILATKFDRAVKVAGKSFWFFCTNLWVDGRTVLCSSNQISGKGKDLKNCQYSKECQFVKNYCKLPVWLASKDWGVIFGLPKLAIHAFLSKCLSRRAVIEKSLLSWIGLILRRIKKVR